MANADAVAAPLGALAGARPGWIRPSRQLCLVLGVLLGMTFAGGAGLYVWQSGQIAEAQKRVAAREEAARASERQAAQLSGLQAEQTAMRGELHFLEASVAPGEYVPTLLQQTEALAKSVHLQVAGIRPTLEPAPAPPADKEKAKTFKAWPYDKIHIDMEVRGGYWNVARLLYRLTEFPKILAVESVQVQPSAGANAPAAAKPGAASPELTAQIKLTGYLFKEAPSAAAAASTTTPPAPQQPTGAGATTSATGTTRSTAG